MQRSVFADPCPLIGSPPRTSRAPDWARGHGAVSAGVRRGSRSAHPVATMTIPSCIPPAPHAPLSCGVMHTRTTSLAAAVCTLLVAGCNGNDPVASAAPEFKQPSFERIMIVVLENENEADAIEQPFLKSLAERGAYLRSYTAHTHPSQCNYIAMVSGDVHGVTDDGDYDLDVRHLGNLLEEKGLRWKVYAEGYPGNCRLDTRIGPYVRRHLPFI